MFKSKMISTTFAALVFGATTWCHAQQLPANPYPVDIVSDYSATGNTQGSSTEFVSDTITCDCVRRMRSCKRRWANRCCDSPWFVRLGVGVILFGESAEFRANNFVVPGASILISDETTFVFDIGYQLNRNWTATLSGGIPPKLDLDGTGPFAGISYGTTKYAPAVFALQRHFYLNRCTSVYGGVGVCYTMQYETVDGLVQNLDIENNAAVALQIGGERRLNERFSLYADAKKVYYRTEAFGNVGPASIRGDVKAYPTALSFGIKYDF